MKNHWLVCPQPNSSATARLFLFPYAGGSPSSFHKWATKFPKDIEVNIVHYPGRGSRFNEPPIKELSVLVEEIKNAIQPELDKPFFFFGHSFGAVLAFELARRLRPQPQILFISACGAPHIPNPNRPIHSLSDSEFIKSLHDFGGLPEEVVCNSELLQLLLPTLRADLEAFETYIYKPDAPLECPIFVLGGQDDLYVSREHLQGWESHTGSHFRAKYFPGDHFFINTIIESIIQSISKEVISLLTRKP